MKTRGDGQRNWTALVAVGTLFGLAVAVPLIHFEVIPDRGFTRGAVQAAARDSFTITQPLRLVDAPRVTIERGTISFVEPSGGRMSTGEAMLAILGGGSAGLILEDATLSISETSAAGPAEAEGQVVPLAPMLDALVRHSFKTLKLTRSNLVVHRPGGGRPIVLTDLDATIAVPKKAPRTARGSVMLAGQSLAFDIALGLDRADGQPAKAPLTATIKSKLVSAEARGHVTLDETLRIDAPQANIRISDLHETARWLGMDWPDGLGPSRVAMTGALVWSSRAFAMSEATVELDGSRATGTMSLKTGGPRPALDGTLAFERLDLSPYLALRESEREARFNLGRLLKWGEWTDVPTTALAGQIDADLRLSSELVTLGTQELGRGAATLSLKGGKLLADVAELELGNGARCVGQLGIDFMPVEPQFALKGQLDDIELARLTRRVVGHPAVRGRARLELDLTSRGSSMAEVLREVSGRIDVGVRKGGQLGADLRTLAATALSRELDGWGGAGRGQTAFDTLDAKLRLSGGTLATDAVSARAGGTVLTVDGVLGLLDRSLDLDLAITHPGNADLLTASAVVPVAAEPPAANASYIRIKGKWDQPRIRLLSAPSKAAGDVPAAPTVTADDRNG